MSDITGNKWGGIVSARDIILDMLSTREDNSLSVAALCQGGACFDIREQSIRVALNRLVRSGKVKSAGRGRYRLDETGNELLPDIKNWIDKRQRMIPWDGTSWIGVADANVARSQKTKWRHHERALKMRGFRRLDSGVNIRPDNLTGGVKALHTDLLALGLADEAMLFGIGEIEEADRHQALKLWDVEGLAGSYKAVLDDLVKSEQSLTRKSASIAAAETLMLGRHAISCILQDPLLPSEIMGGEDLNALVKKMQGYRQNAKTLWDQVLGETV